MDDHEVIRIACAVEEKDFLMLEKADWQSGACVVVREGKLQSMVRIDREGIRDLIAYLVELLEDDE